MTQVTFIPGLSNRSRGTQNGRSLMWKQTGNKAVLAGVTTHPYACKSSLRRRVGHLGQLRQHHWEKHIVANTT